MKNHWQKIQLTAALVITLLSSIAYSPLLWAQIVTSSSSAIEFTPPPPPPDRSAAGDRGGAASRGCSNGKESLMALVPTYKQTINLEPEETIPVTKVWGLTTSEYPTFWFFIPFDKSSITTIEFVLKDESQKPSKTIYQSFLNKPEMPGIIRVPMNKTSVPLAVSQTRHQKMYHWFLKVRVKCNLQQPAELHFVEGWIERVNLNSDLGDRFEELTPLQKVALYGKNGIWHSALTTLAELRLTNLNHKNINLLAEWTTLLQSVDLENLANYPLINCCESDLISCQHQDCDRFFGKVKSQL